MSTMYRDSTILRLHLWLQTGLSAPLRGRAKVPNRGLTGGFVGGHARDRTADLTIFSRPDLNRVLNSEDAGRARAKLQKLCAASYNTTNSGRHDACRTLYVRERSC